MTNNSFSGRAPTAASFGAPLRPPVFGFTVEPVSNIKQPITQAAETTTTTGSTQEEATQPVINPYATTQSPAESYELHSEIETTEIEVSSTEDTSTPLTDDNVNSLTSITPEGQLKSVSSSESLVEHSESPIEDIQDVGATANAAPTVSDDLTVDNSDDLEIENLETENSIIEILNLVEEKLTDATKTQANDSSIRVGRVDSQELPYRIQKLRNKTIYKVITEWRKNGIVPSTLLVRGTIITNNRMPGIWDEGGANGNEGSVLIAADPEGNRITPVVVNCGIKTVNGKHALVQIWEGCFIIVGWHRGGKEIISVYLVDEIIPADPSQDDPSPKFSCTLQGYVSKHKWVKSSAATAKISLSLGHPMIVAAEDQLFRQHSVVPGYAGDYIEHYFPVEDYNEWEKDPVVLEKFTEETSIRKVYATAEKLFAPFTSGHSSQKALLMIVFTVTNNDEVHAYILAGIYDSTVRTTRGNRLMYCRLALKEDSVFYYPDRDDVPKNRLNINSIKETLLAQPVHTLAMAFRRVSNSSHYDYFKNLNS